MTNNRTWQDEMKPEYQRAVDQFVQREVIYCVSSLIHELAQKEEYMEDLMDVLVQDDWETAAIENDGKDFLKSHADVINYEEIKQDIARDFCEANDIDPYQREAYEHWIVTGWLADKLEAHGEMVLRDFLGLTIWGRTTTGQSISMDSVIMDIYDELTLS